MSMPGIAGAAVWGLWGTAISMPGIGVVVGGTGLLMSIPGIASGCTGATGAGLTALRATRLAAGLRAGALAFGLGLAAGFAGIVMPGMGMPPIDCAAVMAGSIATAAAVASKVHLVTEYLRESVKW
jgi:hypothetical protein